MSKFLDTTITEDDRLRQIACHIPGVIYQFWINPEGSLQFLYASDGLREVHGVSPAEAYEDATKVFTVIHPEDIDRVTQSILESAANMTPWYCEYRVNLPHERQLWLLSHSTPQQEADGSILWHGYIQNITASKTIEIALQVSENKFRGIIENLNDMVYIINSDASSSYVSPQFQEVMGYELAELLNNSLTNWVHPEDVPICLDALQRAFEGEKIRGVEYRVLHQDDNYYWHSSNLSALHNEKGEVTACLGIARDISDRKAAEKSLQKTNNFLHSVLETMPDFFFAKDLEGRHIVVNSNLAQFFGKPVADIIGKTDAELLPPDIAKKIMAKDREIMTTGIAERFEEVVPTDGAADTYYLTVKTPLLDAQGDITGLIGVAQNITDRKQAELKNQETQNFLSSIIENIPHMVFVKDAENLQFLRFNKAGEELLGYPRETLLGKSDYDFFSPEEAAFFVAKDREVLASGTVIDIPEESIQTNHQGTRILHTRKIPLLDEFGHPQYLLGISEDITDRKQAQKEQARLLDILEATSDFVGSADSHGRVLYLNRSARKMLALKPEDEISHRHLAQHHPEWANQIISSEGLPETMRSGFWLGESAILKADGQEIPVSQLIVAHRSEESGEIEYFSTIARDISDSKAAEKKLRQNEQKYHQILDAITDMVLVKGPQSRIVWANKAFRDYYAMTNEQLQDMIDAPFNKPEYTLQYIRDDAYVFETGKSLEIEEPVTRYDGKVQVFNTIKSVIRNEANETILTVGVSRDISDRKAAEVALSEYADRQTLLNQLVHQIRNSLDLDAVIATTIQSIRDLLDIDACTFAWYIPNAELPIWEVIQESKLEEIPSSLGCYSPTFVGPIEQLLCNQEILRIDDAAQYEEPIHRAFLNIVNCQSEILLPIQTHSNRIGVIICAHYCQVRPWKDSEIQLLKAISDQLAIAINQAELYAESRSKRQELQNTLQELQNTQTQMIQSEKMSSLGQLVAGIAHEINNPISFIYGNIQPATTYVEELIDLVYLYQEQYSNPPQVIAKRLEEINLEYLVSDFSRLLESMKNGATRIRDIIRSLRTFSRLDEVGCKAINIHENLESTLVILQSRLNGRDGTPEIHLIRNYGDLPPVECYVGLLNQVFVNLLMNAIDAIEQYQNSLEPEQRATYAGMITITTSVITSTITSTNQAVISIQDNGSGMSPQVQEKIFNPFFTTKPIGKGTGMGLAISYQIMEEKHQGNILVNSTPGEGTEFVITLPIKQVSVASMNES